MFLIVTCDCSWHTLWLFEDEKLAGGANVDAFRFNPVHNEDITRGLAGGDRPVE